jgi:anti-anti-sigma factor
MAQRALVFEVERHGDTVLLTPASDLRELDYTLIESGAREAFGLLESGPIKNLILDFHRTDYYGSTALGFFVRLWKRVSARGGQMVFCNLSDHEAEILKTSRLDGLWPICSSREEAFELIRRRAPLPPG